MDAKLKGEVKRHFEKIAPKYDVYKSRNKFYYNRLSKVLKELINPNSTVLDIGCGTGTLLASINPKLGVGVDISRNMIRIAKQKYRDRKNLSFVEGDAEFLPLNKKFDYIVMIDLIEHLDDVFNTFENLQRYCSPKTKIIISSINPLWSVPLHVLEKLNLKMPEGVHNWISIEDIKNILTPTGFDIVKTRHELFSLIQILIVKPDQFLKNRKMSVSVIVPAYNEEGNIQECVKRLEKSLAGRRYEIIIVNDGSKDNTEKIAGSLCNNNVKLITYPENKGKGFAVEQGFNAAKNDIIAVFDADMAVPPEEIDRFFTPIEIGKADFVNGTRLLYPMEKQAMNYLHLFGNKMFGSIFTWLIEQRITDTLCGTKSIKRELYRKYIKLKERSWPDFDLLFGAAKHKLSIAEVPIHYKKRRAGKSKMKTLKHGFLLFRMCIRGFMELKVER
jgi:ubiquinone/menaquinone biosynthesis C-methylase UbiE